MDGRLQKQHVRGVRFRRVLLRSIREKMQITEAVPVHLYGQLARFIQTEGNNRSFHFEWNLLREGADDGLMNRSLPALDPDLHRSFHVKIGHGSLSDIVHVHLHFIYEEWLPDPPRNADANLKIISAYRPFGCLPNL